MTATTTFGTAPLAPANLQAFAYGPAQVNLSWTDTANETNYVLERSTDGGATFVHHRTLWTNAASASDTGLTPGTTYHYHLRAYNEVGQGPASSVVSATTETLTVPAAPSGLQVAYQQGNVVTLTWNDNSNSESGFIIEAELYDPYYEEFYWEEVASPRYNHHQFSNLEYNAAYTWRVSASNAAGTSPASNTVLVVTGPAAPTNVAASRTDANTITVTWADVAGESAYIVQRSTGSVWQTLPYATVGAGVTSFVDTAASERDNFYYRIVARATSDSAPSAAVTVLTTYAPQQPTGLVAGPSLRGENVQVKWNDVQGETGYRVRKSADNGATWQTIDLGNANHTTWDDWDVVVGRTYLYHVVAYNGVGASAESVQASGSASAITQVPAAPQNLRATNVTTDTVRLTWDADYERNYSYFVERYDAAPA